MGNRTPNRLREIRREIGLTQPQLGEITGQHVTTISNIERGAVPPPKWYGLVLQALRAGLRPED